MSEKQLYKVEPDIVKYYQSCLKSYESVPVDEKYEILLKAVASLNKNGIKVCYHGSICAIIERFVTEFPTNEVIGCLFRSINTYLDGVIIGKNTSRLLEKVLWACKSNDVAQDEIVKFQSQKFLDYMWIHYPDNLENNIGSHIVRSFFQFAFGVYVGMEDKVYSTKSVVVATPMEDKYLEKLNDLIKRFLMNPQIEKLITNEYMSSTFQIILIICSVRCSDKFNEVVKHLLSVLCGINGKISSKMSHQIEIPSNFKDKYQSFFLECFILCLPDGKDWTKFSKKYLQLGKEKFIAEILINSNSCGLFKSAVKRSTDPQLLLEIIQQIKISLYEMPEFECGNIFLKLLLEFINKIPTIPASEIAMFRSYKNSITEIIQFLSKSDTAGTVTLSKFLTNGIKIEEGEDSNDNQEEEVKICSLWSSMVMQAILKEFKPVPKTINKMFIGLTPENLVQFCCDAKASRIIEAFINSTNVVEDTKTKLFDCLTSDDLLEISCSKFGSRVMDCIHHSCSGGNNNNKLFSSIKMKLESQKTQLKTHRIGKFIESKFFGYVPKYMSKTIPEKKTTNQKRSLNEKNIKNKKQKFL